jgi:hypothetical protein
MNPNVTGLLKKKCKCLIFDVMDLHVQDRFSSISHLN